MIFWSITFIIIFAALSSSIIADNPCRFYSSTKGIIDLSSLGRNDGIPAYPDKIPPGSGYKYSYNPCKPFSEGTNCVKVSACQVSLDGALTFSLGTQESAKWSEGARSGDAPSVSYSIDGKQAIVTLICSHDGTNLFEALGEGPQNVYNFRLTHKCACWNGCEAPPQQNCSINGSVYKSDKQIIQSFPFHVSIDPPPPQPSPPTSSYAIVDTNSQVIELTLVDVSSVPPGLFCLGQLKVLSLLDSEDVTLSSDILHLASSLTSLTMSNISKPLFLPPELFDLTRLSTLSIVNCGLETLSEDIVKLGQLTQLILDNNQLITLPSTLGKMPSLTSLSVNGNSRLSSLDALSGSTSLITLRGSNCMINHLPTDVYHLSTIEMNNNQLTSLDGIETIPSPSFDFLSFGKNKITSISASSLQNIQTLLYFDLSNNLLTVLPDSIYRIRSLQLLNITDNNFDEKEREWIQGIFRITNTTVIM